MANEIKQIRLGPNTTDPVYDVTDKNVKIDTTNNVIDIHGDKVTFSLSGSALTITITSAS